MSGRGMIDPLEERLIGQQRSIGPQERSIRLGNKCMISVFTYRIRVLFIDMSNVTL